MHRFISNFLCFWAANAAVSAAKWVATLHDFGKKWSRFWFFLWNFVKIWHEHGEPKEKKHQCCVFFSKLLLIFFPNLEETSKLFTKYSNSHAISVVILQQSGLCSQQSRLSFCAILTKFCKFCIFFNKTLTKFYKSF